MPENEEYSKNRAEVQIPIDPLDQRRTLQYLQFIFL